MPEEYAVRIKTANPILLLHMLELCDIRVKLAVTREQAMRPFMLGCQATHALCALNKSNDLNAWEFEVE